jgi:GNAT superfamily N-acetyltransferase
LPLHADAWLSKVLGFPVFATGPEGDTPSSGERSLTYTKVPVEATETVFGLTARGFAVVDVNVTLTFGTSQFRHEASSVTVAPARPDHGGALADIAANCFRYSRFHLDPLLPNDLADRVKREWVMNYVRGRRGVELLAATKGDRPVGFLAVLETDDARVIDLVGVSPDAQRQGVGIALISAFIQRHAPLAAELRTGTQIANVPSLCLYERLGFSISSAAYVLHLHQGL